jgi:hypothetical protein
MFRGRLKPDDKKVSFEFPGRVGLDPGHERMVGQPFVQQLLARVGVGDDARC